MAKSKEQRESVVPSDLERPGLRVTQPSFGDQIVEERMQPRLAEMRSGLQGEGEGNGGMAAFEVRRVVSERTAAAGLLAQLASVAFIVVNLAPECGGHNKPILHRSVIFAKKIKDNLYVTI